MIVEGANGPVTTEADAVLTARGITIVPDVVANSGGATVCHFERSQGLSDQYWDLDTVNAHLERRILNAYRYAKEAAGDVGTGSLRLGAWAHALRKIEKAMQLRDGCKETTGRRRIAMKSTKEMPPRERNSLS